MADKPKRQRRSAATIDPAISATAKRVVDHYQQAVKPGFGPERGIANVAKLLDAGRTEAELISAADRYAASSRDQDHRMAVGNFYGEKAGYLDHLACQTAIANGGNGNPSRGTAPSDNPNKRQRALYPQPGRETPEDEADRAAGLAELDRIKAKSAGAQHERDTPREQRHRRGADRCHLVVGGPSGR